MYDSSSHLHKYVFADEKIIWEGGPDPSIHFCNRDIFLVPFSLLWGGFAIFWEAMAVMQAYVDGKFNPELFPMILFGIPFVLLGLYFMFGRLLVKAARKQKTSYMITDQRILSLHRFPWETFREVDLATVYSISLDKGLFGGNTLSFESKEPGVLQTLFRMNGSYENTGMEILFPFDLTGQMNFYDLKDIDEAYRSSREALSKLKKQN